MRKLIKLVRATLAEFVEEDPFTHAGALSYSSLLSFAPLLLMVVSVAGLVYGEEAARGEVLAQLEKVDNAAQLKPLEDKITALGDGLNVLAEVVSGLQVGDAVARTKILEDISTVFGHHGRVRATYQSVRKHLLTREGKAEFGAQFKLFAQTVSSALTQCDTPEKCDDQLAKLLVQLEELSGRFSEFDEFLGELAAKREEVHDALAARKQTLLDERQARVQSLVAAADRILEGVGRRAQTFKTADELNAYFAADAMVLKAKELAERMAGLGASVKADEISSKVISARQDALRALRDRLELFDGGNAVVKFGSFRFNVNTQVLDVTLLARGDQMALHLGGTDFFEPIDDVEFNKTREYWHQQIVSETEQVYRGEYLAAAVLAAAESGEQGLDLQRLYAAEREPGGLLDLVRRFSAERYDEGYERGLHDADAAAILEKLLALRATAGLLRVSPGPRALACLFWAYYVPAAGEGGRVNDMRPSWHRRAQSVARLRAAFRFTPLAACDPPDGAMLDIGGCAHLFGGEAAMIAAMMFPTLLDHVRDVAERSYRTRRIRTVVQSRRTAT